MEKTIYCKSGSILEAKILHLPHLSPIYLKRLMSESTHDIRFEEMSFCRLSMQPAEEEAKIPSINLNKVIGCEEDEEEEHLQKVKNDQGSVFDFEKQSDRGFITSRT